MNTPAVTRTHETPLMGFWARVGGSRVSVKLLRSGIEWFPADLGSVIAMPSITAVSVQPGWFRSTLVVEADGRRVQFRLDRTLAVEARGLIRLLMTVVGSAPVTQFPKVVGEEAVADDLIDLRSLFDDGSVDYDEYEEQRARLLGFERGRPARP